MIDENQHRILYVGRNQSVAADLRTRLQQFFSRTSTAAEANDADNDASGGANGQKASLEQRTFEFTAISNQKSALSITRDVLVGIILVHTDETLDSRARFCEMLRYRLPNTTIWAISHHEPKGRFAFDGWLRLPLEALQLEDVLTQVQANCTDHLLQMGPIQLDLTTRIVDTPNGSYRMTPKQCGLLEILMLHQGHVVTRSTIMEAIWETTFLEDTRTLDVHIRWLRERIEPEPSNPIYLKTQRGVGYKLSVPTN